MATNLTDWEVFTDIRTRLKDRLDWLSQTNQTNQTNLSKTVSESVVESAALQLRALVEILISDGNKPDDILLDRLLPSFSNVAANAKPIEDLKTTYGKNVPGTPRWTLNKMNNHGTTVRLSAFDYGPVIQLVVPKVDAVLGAIDNFKDGSANPSAQIGINPNLCAKTST